MIASILGTAANVAMNAINNRRNMQNYYAARAYNTPAAQIGRFRSAGLNPHLIYTQTNESDMPPQLQNADFSPLQNFASELSQYQGIEESKARVSNIEKTNQMLSEQIYGQILSNELNKVGLKWSDYEHWLQTEQGKQALENAKKTSDLITAQIDKVTRETKFKDFEEFKGWFDMFTKSSELELMAKRLNLDYDKLREQIREFDNSNFLKVWFNKFIKGFSGENPKNAAENLGVLLRSLLNAQVDSEGSGLPLLDEVRKYFRDIENKRHGGSF